MTCALASKDRCAVIMLTSSVVKSTFELSRAPDWMLPKPAEDAVPCTTLPEVKVCDQFVSPNCFRPCGLGKFAMANCPSSVERPLVYTADTMPEGSMATGLNWPGA